MRKYFLSLSFVALAATFAFLYFNMGEQMSESGGTSLNPDDEESVISSLLWGLRIACQRTMLMVSKWIMLLGYLALSIPCLPFLLAEHCFKNSQPVF